MRIVNFLLACMFLVFAFLQVNDPDPVLWILVYGAMAVIAVMAIFEFYPKRVLRILLIVFAAFSTVYIPGVLEWLRQEDKATIFDEMAKEEHHFIEESREFLGLLICALVLVFYLFRAARKIKAVS